MQEELDFLNDPIDDDDTSCDCLEGENIKLLKKEIKYKNRMKQLELSNHQKDKLFGQRLLNNKNRFNPLIYKMIIFVIISFIIISVLYRFNEIVEYRIDVLMSSLLFIIITSYCILYYLFN
ncbi:hypothetical protein EHI8A_036860 [Entamoeba histolytica HM-1:IMSS-B]|uniref:Uncharacterized protein n=6 Tax=Entamoeba histolytica TaxID=5759 RepID=C4M121_ENTH1|nr:hypothetical protein EHI_105160 [Entamoeba histolytica HM-1:IMSS]EMD45509.1 Hypothetical protein EHI5A_061730 [Entamoeba histolytica KU27]EMH72334.1 hypothetical protein EHI8A_036860 [Entamoeba histolytica HM-1:IMSS-B]EMS14792.1 hypothetical protein KM1_039090 [Entamoeba histolytica HM-3:IMSS]ENY63575.1 hypothetical protein EHI7A_009680 [Entamoeba histolytica HM-1:IMSS-A]GAT94893.1 hypothetical protein CL6EHI_105160 [Entamoeba histolytica]|eukprot:XP_653925.1 hypothetical protein EHI_105160 [Entamoeba histolytica HM-1:IMSS]